MIQNIEDKETWFAFEQITSKRKETNPDRGEHTPFPAKLLEKLQFLPPISGVGLSQ